MGTSLLVTETSMSMKFKLKSLVNVVIGLGLWINVILLQIRHLSLSHNGLIVGTAVSSFLALWFLFAAGINAEKYNRLTYGEDD